MRCRYHDILLKCSCQWWIDSIRNATNDKAVSHAHRVLWWLILWPENTHTHRDSYLVNCTVDDDDDDDDSSYIVQNVLTTLVFCRLQWLQPRPNLMKLQCHSHCDMRMMHKSKQFANSIRIHVIDGNMHIAHPLTHEQHEHLHPFAVRIELLTFRWPLLLYFIRLFHQRPPQTLINGALLIFIETRSLKTLSLNGFRTYFSLLETLIKWNERDRENRSTGHSDVTITMRSRLKSLPVLQVCSRYTHQRDRIQRIRMVAHTAHAPH